MPNVVLVVDMVRGFCEEGHNLYLGQPIRDMIPRTQKFLREQRDNGSHILFLCDTHDPDDKEFEVFPVHCVRGTEEPEVIPELREFAEEIIPKRRYSCFFDTNLGERLEELSPYKVIIIGVCTDICVQYTAADARNRDYAVEVPADLVMSFNEEGHKSALKQFESILGVKVTRKSS